MRNRREEMTLLDHLYLAQVLDRTQSVHRYLVQGWQKRGPCMFVLADRVVVASIRPEVF
jgi:hypothetical protein